MSNNKRKHDDEETVEYLDCLLEQQSKAYENLNSIHSILDDASELKSLASEEKCKTTHMKKKLQKLIHQNEKVVKQCDVQINTMANETKHLNLRAYVSKHYAEMARAEENEPWMLEADKHATHFIDSMNTLDPNLIKDHDDAEDIVDVLDASAQPQKNDIGTTLRFFSEENDNAGIDEVVEVRNIASSTGFTVSDQLYIQLKTHQKHAVKRMIETVIHDQSGICLAHVMGLGKTLTSIAFLDTLMKDNPGWKVIVSCPKSITPEWMKQFEQWKHLISCTCIFAKSHRSANIDEWRKTGGILLMSHDTFSICQNGAKLLQYDLIIVDEAHRMQNPKTRLHMSLNKCSCNRRVLLTGTPLQNNILEYYYMIRLLRPSLVTDLTEFKRCYATPIKKGSLENATNEECVIARKKINVLTKLFEGVVDRKTAEFLHRSLPQMREYKCTYEAPLPKVMYLGQQWKVVDTVTHTQQQIQCKDLAKAIKRRKSDEVTFTQKQLEDMNVPTLSVKSYIKVGYDCFAPIPPNFMDFMHRTMTESKSTKIKLCLKLIKNIDTKDQIIVFSSRKDVLHRIKVKLLELGQTSDVMTGDDSEKNRSDIVTRFQSGEFRILCMTKQVGGMGLNLTKANHILILNPSWNPAEDTQACYRCYRLGQLKQVFIYRFVVKDSIEENIWRLSAHKHLAACRLLDKKSVENFFKEEQLKASQTKSVELFEENFMKKEDFEDTDSPALRLTIESFTGITRYDTLFEENSYDKLSKEEQADADNEFNIVLHNQEHRTISTDERVTTIDIQERFVTISTDEQELVKPLPPAYVRLNAARCGTLGTTKLVTFLPIVPSTSENKQYYFEFERIDIQCYGENDLSKTTTTEKTRIQHKKGQIEINMEKHEKGFYRFRVRIEYKDQQQCSPFSDWSAPVEIN